MHSAITGLTLPGIIDEPGCTAGSNISFNPVVGPEDNNLRSFEILTSSKANSFKELDMVCTRLQLWSASKEFLAGIKGKPQRAPNLLMASTLY